MKSTKTNVALSIVNIALINKIDGQFQYFDRVFSGTYGKAKNHLSSIKLFIYNKLAKSVSVNRLKSVYPEALFDQLDFTKIPSDRSLYREMERVGQNFDFLIERQQRFAKEEGLITNKQYIDFSSSFFEGNCANLGALGYSRDHRPGKKQITYGLSVGINGIPSALTIQKGNVVDKVHFSFMLKTASVVLDEQSLLIFDCGANTKKNKDDIRAKKFHYLTLKQKKVGPYKTLIQQYNAGNPVDVNINGVVYKCVKVKQDYETNYIFFNEKAKEKQFLAKEKKFQKLLKKNQKILEKTKRGKEIHKYKTSEGEVVTTGSLQKTLGGKQVQNPYVNGLEGYFVLQSSVDTEPLQILALYKDKDKVEKLVRSLKEGTEIRPIRHWSDNAIKGNILIHFLTNFLISLTLWLAKNPLVKNVKLLKKYLNNLTLVILYPPTGFKMEVLANISEEIRSIFGNYIDKLQNTSWKNRW